MTMSGLEFHCFRHLFGLSVDELAERLDVSTRTLRSFESGRDPINTGVEQDMHCLNRQHAELAQLILDSDEVVTIPRSDDDWPYPRGWYVAAIARAMNAEPNLMAEWDYGTGATDSGE